MVLFYSYSYWWLLIADIKTTESSQTPFWSVHVFYNSSNNIIFIIDLIYTVYVLRLWNFGQLIVSYQISHDLKWPNTIMAQSQCKYEDSIEWKILFRVIRCLIEGNVWWLNCIVWWMVNVFVKFSCEPFLFWTKIGCWKCIHYIIINYQLLSKRIVFGLNFFD